MLKENLKTVLEIGEYIIIKKDGKEIIGKLENYCIDNKLFKVITNKGIFNIKNIESFVVDIFYSIEIFTDRSIIKLEVF
ncbi:hypothetical protein ACFO6R_06460 [Eubacterium multiforme]|uniref:Uncharacterized protein n=1 Tax=Eubacterium multiforme TaxID=83339 RepID=A0ABT9USF1_9FIRM|nr:hypothetical protein [Eubacterium multiforme]MDQ0149236.1 hypothetical protein [Eubacterium multiforme]